MTVTRSLTIFLLFSVTSPIVTCNQSKMKRTIVERVHLTTSEDAVAPPPPNLKPTFRNLHDWLISVCESHRPKTRVSIYATGLWESDKERVLFIVGMAVGANQEDIVFQPQNSYLLLPSHEYGELSQDQLDYKLIGELKDFTATNVFTSSFLAECDSILFKGKTVIWSKTQ